MRWGRRVSTQLGYLSGDDLGRPLEVDGKPLGVLVEVKHHTTGGKPLTTVKTVDATRLRRETHPQAHAAVVTVGERS